jgi:hypothetical protein
MDVIKDASKDGPEPKRLLISPFFAFLRLDEVLSSLLAQKPPRSEKPNADSSCSSQPADEGAL